MTSDDENDNNNNNNITTTNDATSDTTNNNINYITFITDGDRYASPTPDDGIKNTKLKVWWHEQLRACVRCIFHKIQK